MAKKDVIIKEIVAISKEKYPEYNETLEILKLTNLTKINLSEKLESLKSNSKRLKWDAQLVEILLQVRSKREAMFEGNKPTASIKIAWEKVTLDFNVELATINRSDNSKTSEQIKNKFSKLKVS